MKIAIIRLSALGDIVQACIILQFIKKNVKNAHISWIIDKKFADILKDQKDIDELIILPLKQKSFKESLQILKDRSFDIAIDMQGLLKSAIVAKIVSKKTFGFDKKSIKEKLASLFYTDKVNCDYNENIIIRNLTLISKALNFTFTKDEILYKKRCLSYKKKNFEFLSATKKNLLIAPFASEKSKIYQHFNEVIKSLDENILICYSNEIEFEQAKEIAKNSSAKLISLNLLDIISLISKIDLVIGNDSGITHIAFAQNCASITLFGNRPSQRNAYQTRKNIVIDAGKKIDARKIDKSDFCINSILPQTIINQAKEILK